MRMKRGGRKRSWLPFRAGFGRGWAESTSAVCVWADGSCEWPVTGLPENARSICGGIWDLLLRPGRNPVGLSSHVPERSRWRGACVGTSSRLWLTTDIAILMPFVVVIVFKGLRMEGWGGNPKSRRLRVVRIHKTIRWPVGDMIAPLASGGSPDSRDADLLPGASIFTKSGGEA